MPTELISGFIGSGVTLIVGLLTLRFKAKRDKASGESEIVNAASGLLGVTREELVRVVRRVTVLENKIDALQNENTILKLKIGEMQKEITALEFQNRQLKEQLYKYTGG